jgi:DNA ligase-1
MDLEDGTSVEVKGSAAKPYLVKNTGGVYTCTCPAWTHQSVAIEKRTCKHIRGLRGDAAEAERVGSAGAAPPTPAAEKAAKAKEKAPPLLLAHSWEGDTDLSGWWMSEKLDGVRAYWDGERFVSRLGNTYHAPDWFTAGLPNVPLDGELWVGRKQFQRTVSIVRRQDRSKEWEDVRYVVFDAPAIEDGFEARMEFLVGTLRQAAHRFATHHQQERCLGVEHLRSELGRVEGLGGEGLMLRKPGSRYEVGRSSTLLKVKSFHDAEAIVIEHLPGTGKHKGRLGALLLEMPNGTRFSAGTGFSDQERQHPPSVGSIVTFRYQELSEAGVPRFPSFVAVRHDFDWAAAKEEATKARS